MGKDKDFILVNEAWNISARVVKDGQTYRVDVYSGKCLQQSFKIDGLRSALIKACDIVGE